MKNETCMKCNGSNLQSGELSNYTLFGFHPKGGSLITNIKATACLDCGLLVFSVDPEEVNAAIKNARRTEKQFPTT